MSIRVDIAIPSTLSWDPMWGGKIQNYALQWQKMGLDVRTIVSRAAMADTAQSMAVDQFFGYVARTSENRNALVETMLEGAAEWLFFIDHDTVPPLTALPDLLALNRPFVGGVYHSRNEPHEPLMFLKEASSARYLRITNYEKGALLPVDACGMGCTLIHRKVFEAIYANYTRFIRLTDGSQILVHNDDIQAEKLPSRMNTGQKVYPYRDAFYLTTPIRRLSQDEEDAWDYPWFQMIDGRTEDLGFCERAIRVGFRPTIDTNVECEHLQQLAITGANFRAIRDQILIAGVNLEGPRPDGQG